MLQRIWATFASNELSKIAQSGHTGRRRRRRLSTLKIALLCGTIQMAEKQGHS